MGPRSSLPTFSDLSLDFEVLLVWQTLATPPEEQSFVSVANDVVGKDINCRAIKEEKMVL